MEKNAFYALLENRTSIRKFKPTPVAKDILDRLLGAAVQAPSGKNRQNWRFYVVQGKKRDEYLEYSQKSWLGIKDILKTRLKPSLYEFTERFFSHWVMRLFWFSFFHITRKTKSTRPVSAASTWPLKI